MNVGALRRSLNEIVRRHESLRTTFTAIDGQPMQVVASQQTLDLELVDLMKFPTDQREPESQRLAMLDAQQPFSLAKGPLLRAALLRIERDDFIFPCECRNLKPPIIRISFSAMHQNDRRSVAKNGVPDFDPIHSHQSAARPLDDRRRRYCRILLAVARQFPSRKSERGEQPARDARVFRNDQFGIAQDVERAKRHVAKIPERRRTQHETSDRCRVRHGAGGFRVCSRHP